MRLKPPPKVERNFGQIVSRVQAAVAAAVGIIAGYVCVNVRYTQYTHIYNTYIKGERIGLHLMKKNLELIHLFPFFGSLIQLVL